jgi:regulator of ribosome biosynthesis
MSVAVAPAKREKLVVTVDKPIPLEFDMGHLTAFDNNPLDPETYRTDREECLAAAIRDGAQALINQVLTALPLKATADGIFAELPEPVTLLPREKPIPKDREPTKWFDCLFSGEVE